MENHHQAELRELGFTVVPNLVSQAMLVLLACAYDQTIEEGRPPELRVSHSGGDVRLSGLLGRGAPFDDLSVLPPVLEACERTIGGPFKLSSMGARTVLPGATAQALHVDVRPDEDAWPLVGFIVMVDEFRRDNGATRFVPGSHALETRAGRYGTNDRPEDGRAVLACGAAGSVIVYHGSTWHGYSANLSGTRRRSVQGAYVPRRGASAYSDKIWRKETTNHA